MTLIKLVSNIFGEHIFEDAGFSNDESANEDNLELQQIISRVENCISESMREKNIINSSKDDRKGRIGPKLVRLDTSSGQGPLIVSSDRLTVLSQSNFSTIRANAGVYHGKWMYEVQLGSKGVIQIGWGTAQCKYNQESGVGDVINSYAYDGNRVRKWNISTYKYGEAWQSGDIIGSTIDLEEGAISFSRNGKDLGVAFGNISMGPGIVYFPTVSLALTENLTANFGTTPMRYPVQGYQILQEVPLSQLHKSQILFHWLEKLLWQYKESDESYAIQEKNHNFSVRALLACLARSIFKQIGPLVGVPYVTQDTFVPFIKKLAKSDCSMLYNCLDLMWTFLEVHEMKNCLETTITHLSSMFRQVSAVLEFPEHRTILVLLNDLCKHARTRQYLLQSILFEKGKFPHFVHIRTLDDEGLNSVVNKVWWETSPPDPVVENSKVQYLEACDKIKFWISEVEALQVELLMTLMNNTDGDATTPTSRGIFLKKFRRFIHENSLSNHTTHIYQIPVPITLCFFHRLLVAFKIMWDTEIHRNPVFIPCRSFCDSSINYFRIDRLGGVLSHLNKTYRNDLLELLGTDHETVSETPDTQMTNLFREATRVADTSALSVFARMINTTSANIAGSSVLERIGYFPYSREDRSPLQPGPLDPEVSLIELLDGIILFYHLTAKKHMTKIAHLRDAMTNYVVAMSSTKNLLEKLQNSKDQDSESIKAQLTQTLEVFDKKLTERARHMAWVKALIFSEEKQERLIWLLKTVVLTMKNASDSGNLFCFVPEFYLDVVGDLIAGLKAQMHPTVSVDKSPEFKEVLREIAQFLCDHFQDPRIVNADSKDTLLLCLAGFVSTAMTLDALESVSKESRIKMVSNLLRSYENRAWAQSNWILVRFWHGNGFAYRYVKSPHIAKKFGPKILHQDSISQPLKPCPSIVYQSHIKEVLISNSQNTILFLNSLLNQLNWVFSEFIGMVQEIHNASSRPERVFIDSRQLKLCATCFDLAIALLRVLEMIACICPSVFIDPSVPSSENLLARLSQLLCQILNRISMPTSSFQHVVLLDIPDLQTVDHFPILTAVIGILIALLKDDMLLPESSEIPRVTKAIISEPSFQISSLYFVLGDVKNTKVANVKPFSFLNFEDDISAAEIDTVRNMIEHLDNYRTKLPSAETSCDEDDLCTICYAYPIMAVFKPCNHTSCNSCIDRHLLNSRICFFCKATITRVVSIDGKLLHDLSNDPSLPESVESGN
ncbi:hypothetical protein QAD02_005296 [Eretmocerus hayati]|uniref:Uncharacterized protein n=1 Tax=Eretmocerus hayati TaxID=131215 RepID=A0ACC2NS02_9HYME|nr:hypothetical protein QAD02_005296 [Eretmocerus hayati]